MVLSHRVELIEIQKLVLALMMDVQQREVIGPLLVVLDRRHTAAAHQAVRGCMLGTQQAADHR